MQGMTQLYQCGGSSRSANRLTGVKPANDSFPIIGKDAGWVIQDPCVQLRNQFTRTCMSLSLYWYSVLPL